MRRAPVAALALVAALGCANDPALSVPPAVGGAGGSHTGGMAAHGGAGGAGAMAPVEEDPYQAAPPVAPLPADAIAEVVASIDAVLATMPAQTHSISIVGAETGQVIYEHHADMLLKPASNTKLFTSATAMTKLGDQHRSDTVVYATSAPNGGVINGDLVVVGDHDFTWSTEFYDDARFPLRLLAESLVAAGITQVTGTVQLRGEVLFDGYSLGTYSAAAERSTAATELAAVLSEVGIVSGGTSTSAELGPPSGAVELVHSKSLPLDVGCSPVNRISHNEFADILSRHLGWEAAGDSSYAAGQAQMIALLDEAPTDAGGNGTGTLDTRAVVFNDGSGLSHGNRVSARHIIALFRLMQGRAEGLAWERTFSVAGVHGTLGSRLTGAETVGRFFGKTGTLNDTIALSGRLEHAHDGQRYLFAMLMNGVTSSTAARATHDQIVSIVAADLRGQSAVPEAPTLLSVANDANAQSITARWTPVSDVDGYLVWRSRDGRVWDRESARYVSKSQHRTLLFNDTDSMFIRVSAVRADFESEPSDTYAARSAATKSRLVLVDGNDRWQNEPVPENSVGSSHDFLARYAELIGDRGFDSCANEAVLDGSCALAGYATVVWSLGEESVDDVALTAAEQDLLRAHTQRGGALLISGAELGYQLAETPSGVQFLEEVLHVSYVGDDAATFTVRGHDGGPLLSFLTPDRMVVNYPDQLEPFDGAAGLFDYVGGQGGSAGVKYQGSYRAVTLGFPFESIDSREDRALAWGSLLAFLSP